MSIILEYTFETWSCELGDAVLSRWVRACIRLVIGKVDRCW